MEAVSYVAARAGRRFKKLRAVPINWLKTLNGTAAFIGMTLAGAGFCVNKSTTTPYRQHRQKFIA
jgi:hypothetical protein